VIMEE